MSKITITSNIRASLRAEQATLKETVKDKSLIHFALEFENIKKEAQSVEEIVEWISNRSSSLLHAEMVFNPRITTTQATNTLPAFTTLYYVNAVDYLSFENENHNTEIRFLTESTHLPALNSVFTYLGANECEEVYSYDEAPNVICSEFDLTIYADESPCVTARIIQAAVNKITTGDITYNEHIEGIEKLLSLHFPGIQADVLINLVHSGLTPTEQPEFSKWLFSYRHDSKNNDRLTTEILGDIAI